MRDAGCALSALVLLAIVVSGGMTWLMRQRAVEARTRAEQAMQIAAEERARADASSQFLGAILGTTDPANDAAQWRVVDVLDSVVLDLAEFDDNATVEANLRFGIGRSYVARMLHQAGRCVAQIARPSGRRGRFAAFVPVTARTGAASRTADRPVAPTACSTSIPRGARAVSGSDRPPGGLLGATSGLEAGAMERAEAQLLAAYALRAEDLGPAHPGTIAAARMLVDVYEATGNAHAAADWRTRIPES